MISLEALLRGAADRGGQVSLAAITAGDAGGFSGCVYYYPDGPLVNRRDPDPIAALRAALIEDERQARDTARRYAAASKAAAPDEFAGLLA